jgi:hypothetical protein
MGKPAFNPNQPFEKVQVQEKPAFNPNQPFQVADTSGPGFDPIAGVLKVNEATAGIVPRIANVIDSYTGAPTRAAIGAAQNAESPLAAFVKQFGENPALAPSGKDLAKKTGASTESIIPDSALPSFLKDTKGNKTLELIKNLATASPAGIYGAGLDIAANPLNVATPVARGVGLLADAASEVPAVSRALETAGKIPGKLATKAAASLTPATEKAIEVYNSSAPEVNNVIKRSGGILSTAADEAKVKIQASIQAEKDAANGLIKQALEDPELQKIQVPTQPILEKLQAAKSKINPHYDPGDIKQINDMMERINQANPSGAMSLDNLYETTKFLRKRSYGSFAENGEIYINSPQAAKAANGARQAATEALHEAAPQIKEADAIHSSLHDVDNRISSSLLTEGKPENIFSSAGGGSGNIHQRNLMEIGQLTGTNPVHDAELIYSAKYFKNKDLRTQALKALIDAKNGLAPAAAGPAGSVSIPLSAGISPTYTLNPAYANQQQDAVSRRLGSIK